MTGRVHFGKCGLFLFDYACKTAPDFYNDDLVKKIMDFWS